jgi:L-seryl-tRNA(Ser) seleniumtransferase
MNGNYRKLPSVERVLLQPAMVELANSYSRVAVIDLVRGLLDEERLSITNGQIPSGIDDLIGKIVSRAEDLWHPAPVSVINATGVILHTNLGRAPLSTESLEAISRVAQGYSNLEFDLNEGKRGSRQAHAQNLLNQITGAKAALVTNNNAAAVLLGLVSVASGGEVIVSRGEAVEIGGGFRVPDVLQQSGVRLVDVGTTNRTYISDYESAISERTTALLKVHPSNFSIRGFTHVPSTADLVKLGRERHVPVLYDLGSGCLIDTSEYGLNHEPTPQEAIADGVDLLFFSGDKLLGGPQAGIVVGNEQMVHKLVSHPLSRALRIDKLSLAGLTATLIHYLKGEATFKIPVWRSIAASKDSLKQRVMYWNKALDINPFHTEIKEGVSAIGGGTLPGEMLPTWLFTIRSDSDDIVDLAMRLRKSQPHIISRIEDDCVVLDPRTISEDEDGLLVDAVRRATSRR